MKTNNATPLKTFGKFVFWTGVGAIVTAVGSDLTAVLTNFHVPLTWHPVIATAIGGALKSWATYASNNAKL